jgi:hypothetical protein
LNRSVRAAASTRTTLSFRLQEDVARGAVPGEERLGEAGHELALGGAALLGQVEDGAEALPQDGLGDLGADVRRDGDVRGRAAEDDHRVLLLDPVVGAHAVNDKERDPVPCQLLLHDAGQAGLPRPLLRQDGEGLGHGVQRQAELGGPVVAQEQLPLHHSPLLRNSCAELT